MGNFNNGPLPITATVLNQVTGSTNQQRKYAGEGAHDRYRIVPSGNNTWLVHDEGKADRELERKTEAEEKDRKVWQAIQDLQDEGGKLRGEVDKLNGEMAEVKAVFVRAEATEKTLCGSYKLAYVNHANNLLNAAGSRQSLVGAMFSYHDFFPKLESLLSDATLPRSLRDLDVLDIYASFPHIQGFYTGPFFFSLWQRRGIMTAPRHVEARPVIAVSQVKEYLFQSAIDNGTFPEAVADICLAMIQSLKV